MNRELNLEFGLDNAVNLKPRARFAAGQGSSPTPHKNMQRVNVETKQSAQAQTFAPLREGPEPASAGTSKTKNRQLLTVHERLLRTVKHLKSSEIELIHALQDAERVAVHRHLGYRSLFQYAVSELKLSEAQSYAFISVARKSLALPKMLEKIEDGEVTVSKAARLVSVINPANQEVWLALASQSNKRELEKALAIANPKLAVPDRISAIDERRYKMEMTLDVRVYLDFLRAQDLVSQNQRRDQAERGYSSLTVIQAGCLRSLRAKLKGT